MLSHFTKLLLVATSISPILITFSLMEVWEGRFWRGLFFGGAAFFLAYICLRILSRAERELPSDPVEFSAIKPADREITAFVVAYLIPLAKAGGASYDIPFLTIVLVIFFLVVLTSNSYHMNPLIGALGYHFYEVTTNGVSHVLISRRTLRHLRGSHEVVSIADYMLLESNPDKK